jgi:glutaconate CoA-transferase subunit B
MELATLHPGATLDEARENTGWELRVADPLPETPPPTERELRLIREQLDPEGSYAQ